MLKKKDCAADFTSIGAVLSKLDHVGFKDLGEVKFTTKNGKLVPVGGPEGKYNRLTKSVNLNSWINWSDPNNTIDLVDGQSNIYPALDAESYKLGIPVDALQFMDITVLHELAHYKGTGDPDNLSYEKKLWNDCIK